MTVGCSRRPCSLLNHPSTTASFCPLSCVRGFGVSCLQFFNLLFCFFCFLLFFFLFVVLMVCALSISSSFLFEKYFLFLFCFPSYFPSFSLLSFFFFICPLTLLSSRRPSGTPNSRRGTTLRCETLDVTERISSNFADRSVFSAMTGMTPRESKLSADLLERGEKTGKKTKKAEKAEKGRQGRARDNRDRRR